MQPSSENWRAFPPAAKLQMLERLRARPTPYTNFRRLPLYPKQAAVVDDPARFTICEATSKAGKTIACLEWLLGEALRVNEGHWWWVATTNDVADIAFRRMTDRLRGYIDSRGVLTKIADPIPHEKNLTRKILRVGGATIWFKSADEPDALFGEDVRAAVGDEVSRWKEDAWFALYTTLTATKGRAKLIGNVKGRRTFAYALARKAEAGEPDWSYHRLTADDAIEGGILDQDVIAQAERDLPAAVFRELYFAEASDDGGNPFGLDAIRACVAPLSAKSPAVWGWDLAKSVDWTVGIALDSDGAVCRLERWQGPWEMTEQRLLAAVGHARALVDSTGVGDPIVERLRRQTHSIEGFTFTQKSKQQIMEGLAVAIQQQRVRFPTGPLVSELESFEFEYTRTGCRYSAPAGYHDDCVCALALAVSKSARRGGLYAVQPLLM